MEHGESRARKGRHPPKGVVCGLPLWATELNPTRGIPGEWRERKAHPSSESVCSRGEGTEVFTHLQLSH